MIGGGRRLKQSLALANALLLARSILVRLRIAQNTVSLFLATPLAWLFARSSCLILACPDQQDALFSRLRHEGGTALSAAGGACEFSVESCPGRPLRVFQCLCASLTSPKRFRIQIRKHHNKDGVINRHVDEYGRSEKDRPSRGRKPPWPAWERGASHATVATSGYRLD